MAVLKKKQRSRNTFNEINITPLTDIFLVLLIIMMVIAPMLDQQGLNLSVPTDKSPQNQKESKIIVIDVNKNNTYSIDGKTVSEANLLSEIKTEMKIKKDGLLIQPDGDASHGAVVAAMDAARNSGIENMSVIEK